MTETRRIGVETFRATFPQAYSLWDARIERERGRFCPMTLEAFWLPGSPGCLVLIQDYGDGHGWQAFTPTTDDGRIDVTLDAIAARAGVERRREEPRHEQ